MSDQDVIVDGETVSPESQELMSPTEETIDTTPADVVEEQ